MFGNEYLNKLKKSTGWPAEEIFAKGPVAVIECIKEIPCNPCETVCPKKCIEVGNPITNLPTFNGDCSGCGKCVTSCPGLAIFIVDKTYSLNEALLTMPYEFFPLPNKGDKAILLNRNGEEIGKAVIERISALKSFNQTALVTIKIPKELADDVRFFKLKNEE